jgi:hypothetical protein
MEMLPSNSNNMLSINESCAVDNDLKGTADSTAARVRLWEFSNFFRNLVTDFRDASTSAEIMATFFFSE